MTHTNQTKCAAGNNTKLLDWGHQNSPWHSAWCFSDRASWIDYTLITKLMHWLLFIH